MNKVKASPVPAVPTDQNSLAWKIFNAFVSDGQITVTENELRDYAVNELKLSDCARDKMPPEFMEHLPVILVAFMNMWSGWHFKGEFLAGKFQKEHYFQRFQKFMIHKLTSMLRGQFANAMKANAMKSLGDTPQADKIPNGKKEPEFSSYAISINCPAHLLNTLVFSNVGDDVIMKQHLGVKWLDLSPVQLVNWPHIEITFRTQDIYFVRRQATEFVRYLNFLPHETNKHSDSIIEHAEAYGHQECYSYDFLEKYVRVYLEALKTAPVVTPAKLYEVQTILVQFLEDVKYMDVNKSMATSTVVIFRLSRVPFIRNKKLVKSADGDEARVGYCEVITPKIQLLLVYCKAKQKDTPTLAFEYTDQIKNPAEHSQIKVVPQITYKCTFCKVEYVDSNSRDLMIQHLKLQHKMEQHVRCTHCKKQFEVLALAACRWRHKCVPTSVWSPPAAVNK